MLASALLPVASAVVITHGLAAGDCAIQEGAVGRHVGGSGRVSVVEELVALAHLASLRSLGRVQPPAASAIRWSRAS